MIEMQLKREVLKDAAEDFCAFIKDSLEDGSIDPILENLAPSNVVEILRICLKTYEDTVPITFGIGENI